MRYKHEDRHILGQNDEYKAIFVSYVSNELLELAINNSNNQQDQYSDDRYRYNPVCSHPAILLDQIVYMGNQDLIPTRHPS